MKSAHFVCFSLFLFVFVPSLFSFALLLKKPQFPVDEVKFSVDGKFVDRAEAYNHDCVAYIYGAHTRPADLGRGAYLRGSREMVGTFMLAAKQWFARGGRRTLNANGIHAIMYEKDIRGRTKKEVYYDTYGMPCNNKAGIQSVRYKYDRRNRCLESAFFSISGSKATNGRGIHRASMSYRKGLLHERSFWGPRGERVQDKRGVHRETYSTQKGMMVFFDSRGKEVKISVSKRVFADGTYVLTKLDDKRRAKEKAWFNADGTPRCDSGKLHRKTFTRNRWGLELTHRHYGLRGYPISHKGYHCKKCTYDKKKPNIFSESYYDERMRPCVNPQKGWHRCEWQYYRRSTKSIAYFGADGKPVPCKKGYVRVDYDRKGRPSYQKAAVANTAAAVTGKVSQKTKVRCFSIDSKKDKIVSAYFRLFKGKDKVEEFYVSHSYKTDKRSGKKTFLPLIRRIQPGAYKVEAQKYNKETKRKSYVVIPKVGVGEIRIDWGK